MLLTGLRTTVSPVAARLMVLLRIVRHSRTYSCVILQPREDDIVLANILHAGAFEAAEGTVIVHRIDDELAQESLIILINHAELHPLLDLLLRAEGNGGVSPAFVGLDIANHPSQIGCRRFGLHGGANSSVCNDTLSPGQIGAGLVELLVEEAAFALGLLEALGEVGVGSHVIGVSQAELVALGGEG